MTGRTVINVYQLKQYGAVLQTSINNVAKKTTSYKFVVQKIKTMITTKSELITGDNIRKMEYPFGWIPMRFITDGIIKMLCAEEILLYIFLSIVSDRDGMSWYGDKRICELTGMSAVDIINARFALEKKGFIAYKKPYYQVLAIPKGI